MRFPNVQQLKKFHVGSTPPRECFTLLGLGSEYEVAKWTHNTNEWQQWLAAKDRGETVNPPAFWIWCFENVFVD